MPVARRSWNTGVYYIRNRVNGKVYVGSASQKDGGIERRIAAHKWLLNNGTHENAHLQRAWDTYGEQAFDFVVILRCPPERCLWNEQQFIDKFKSADSELGYNISPTAGNCLGVKHSIESRRNMARAHVGKKASVGTRAKMSAARKGKKMPPRSDEWRAKQSAAHTGQLVDEGTKLKISAAHKGKKKSHEQCRKMSDAQRGRVFSDEHRAKLSIAARNRRPKG